MTTEETGKQVQVGGVEEREREREHDDREEGDEIE